MDSLTDPAIACRLHAMSGALPYLKSLAPNLSGSALAGHLASELDVSYSTVYDWMNRGMATAQTQNVLKVVNALIKQGRDIGLQDISRMCQVDISDERTEEP